MLHHKNKQNQSNLIVTRVLIFVQRLIAAFDNSLLLSPCSDVFLSLVDFTISSSICFIFLMQYLIISFFNAHLKKFSWPIVVENSSPSQSV
ncbi:hypothetical protein PBCV1_a472L [Paramecium bursaria Chlorella virus 1]|uniref:Uncharacterized protein n=1 Tax=Paramecium bursaria Chlorella virus 1 TaxID=10506 RepID=Q98522_PBCV1|nr:hypothetical protein PBCV1_a472L [Paramecium bursaria Chlorella virus 1]AAC96839.1 hypothetical protein [Paramecium bursaria Chlorella virus 1]